MYLDRIEDQKFAVILVEEINKEYIIPKAELPEGSNVKSYFELTIENNKITSINLNEEASRAEQQNVDEMMSKLRSKSKGSKYKK